MNALRARRARARLNVDHKPDQIIQPWRAHNMKTIQILSDLNLALGFTKNDDYNNPI